LKKLLEIVLVISDTPNDELLGLLTVELAFRVSVILWAFGIWQEESMVA